MAVADISKSVQHLVFKLFRNAATTNVTNVISGAVTVTTPTQGAANNTGTVTGTLTGVKLGDQVIACAPTTALPANQLLDNCYVTANDTITFVFDSITGATVGASKVFNVTVLTRN